MTISKIHSEVFKYLKTIPEIQFCFVEIFPFAILLRNINHTNLPIDNSIDTYSTYFLTEEKRINLIQANIKQSVAIEISNQLQKMRKIHTSAILDIDKYPFLRQREIYKAIQ